MRAFFVFVFKLWPRAANSPSYLMKGGKSFAAPPFKKKKKKNFEKELLHGMYEHSQASRWNSCTSILKPPNRDHTGGLRCHELLIRELSDAVEMPTVVPERVS
jgi:hypothetical protein